MSGKYQKKRRRKPLGFLLAALSLMLLLGALGMTLANKRQEAQAEEAVKDALAALPTPTQTVVSEVVTMETVDAETKVATGPAEETDPTDPPTLSSEFLDGHEYVGYLEFPSLDRKLPIMKIKYLEDLQIAPCLEKGSPHTDNAVICAHNYPAHFGPIRDWKGGEEVIFTDLENHVIRYTAHAAEQISPYDVEKVMESEHDLVLYTCTTGGANRVMIACDRTGE